MPRLERLAVALDTADWERFDAWCALFGPRVGYLKVGLEAYVRFGPRAVERARESGARVFLDLKLHDIPNTVRRAMRSLSALDVDITNLHAAGTIDMMRAALEGLTRPDGSRPKLIAVTQLTSTSEERMRDELLISATMEDTVAHYAKNAQAAGLDGVVCSPHEAALVKRACGRDFITVTPGVRFADSAADDQARVMTPERARLGGSDMIVVGRPITAAKDPVEAYLRCVREFGGIA